MVIYLGSTYASFVNRERMKLFNKAVETMCLIVMISLKSAVFGQCTDPTCEILRTKIRVD